MTATCAGVNVPTAPSGWRGALRSIAVPEAWFEMSVLPAIGLYAHPQELETVML